LFGVNTGNHRILELIRGEKTKQKQGNLTAGACGDIKPKP
jgi:hypothetical protein